MVSDNERLIVAGDTDNDFHLSGGDKTFLTIKANGDVFVNEEYMETNQEIYDGFKRFLSDHGCIK